MIAPVQLIDGEVARRSRWGSLGKLFTAISKVKAGRIAPCRRYTRLGLEKGTDFGHVVSVTAEELLVSLLDGPEHDPYDLPTLQRLKVVA